MTANMEEKAFDLFIKVHGSLGHVAWLTREVFDAMPERKRMWLCVTTVLEEGKVVPKNRWLDDYAYDLFVEVHRRLEDGVRLDRESFNSLSSRREAWCAIARIVDERR